MGLPLSERQRSHKPLMHGLTARTISSLVSGFLSLLGGGGASGALGVSSCCCCARTVSRAAAGRPAERPTRWEPTQATLLADAVEHTRDPLRTSIPIFSYRDTVSRSKIDRLFAVLYSHHQLLPYFPRSIWSEEQSAARSVHRMLPLRTVAQALAVILGIWALGQVYYPRTQPSLGDRPQPGEAQTGTASAATVAEVLSPPPHAEIGLCFIVRTYWAHGPAGGSGSPLAAMLTSFVQSEHRK